MHLCDMHIRRPIIIGVPVTGGNINFATAAGGVVGGLFVLVLIVYCIHSQLHCS